MPSNDDTPASKKVELPPDLLERVADWCASQDEEISVQEFVETAVLEFVERKELQETALEKKRSSTGRVSGG